MRSDPDISNNYGSEVKHPDNDIFKDSEKVYTGFFNSSAFFDLSDIRSNQYLVFIRSLIELDSDQGYVEKLEINHALH